jgi:hypothetical protein
LRSKRNSLLQRNEAWEIRSNAWCIGSRSEKRTSTQHPTHNSIAATRRWLHPSAQRPESRRTRPDSLSATRQDARRHPRTRRFGVRDCAADRRAEAHRSAKRDSDSPERLTSNREARIPSWWPKPPFRNELIVNRWVDTSKGATDHSRESVTLPRVRDPSARSSLRPVARRVDSPTPVVAAASRC